MTSSPGLAADRRTQITQILSVQVVKKNDKYLGMPAVIGCSKQHIFSGVWDIVWNRIN